tara:strand:+ start:1624 stop:2388 length:765 start_codon:yes stop_codon:yes gene_type:complete
MKRWREYELRQEKGYMDRMLQIFENGENETDAFPVYYNSMLPTRNDSYRENHFHTGWWRWSLPRHVMAVEVAKGNYRDRYSLDIARLPDTKRYWQQPVLNGQWCTSSLVHHIAYALENGHEDYVTEWLSENIFVHKAFSLLIQPVNKVIDTVDLNRHYDFSRMLSLRVNPEQELFDALLEMKYTRHRVGMFLFEMRMASQDGTMDAFVGKRFGRILNDNCIINYIDHCGNADKDTVNTLKVQAEILRSKNRRSY